MEDRSITKWTFNMYQDIYKKMISHCLNELPFEACGLLSGENGQAKNIWLMKNILQSPFSFEMDLKEIEHVFGLIEGRGEELVGIYHSHPTASPYPSPVDIENARYPDVAYFIVSLLNNRPQVGCFKIQDKSVTTLPLKII